MVEDFYPGVLSELEGVRVGWLYNDVVEEGVSARVSIATLAWSGLRVRRCIILYSMTKCLGTSRSVSLARVFSYLVQLSCVLRGQRASCGRWCPLQEVISSPEADPC
jgi:hypothetical protein